MRQDDHSQMGEPELLHVLWREPLMHFTVT